MHKTEIRPDALTRMRARRGRLHLRESLRGPATALVVIDMQNVFVQPERLFTVPAARAIVPNLNRLADCVRNRGGTVVWVSTTFADADRDDWSVLFRSVYDDPAYSRAVMRSLQPGSPDHALWSELRVRREDWQVTKNRFSAFLPGASDLETRLRRAAVDTVVIGGTLTNVCCDTSARDAMMRNFHVVMVADGNAALTDADHNGSLTALAQTFADVMTTDEVIERLAP